MSNSMGIASVFVLSSLLLSPLAMAEESPAFIARNQALSAQAEQAFAQRSDTANAPQHAASRVENGESADS